MRSLTAKLTYPSVPQGTDADIAKVKVELPKQLPSRLTTLQKACTDKQFEANPAACPSESKIGYATVHTPLIPVPLQGPVIFVSHGGEAFPSLTMVLQGYGITIDLVGSTFISKAGVTSDDVQDGPRPAVLELRTDAPRGQVLRPGGEREAVRADEDRDGQEEGHGQGQGPQAHRHAPVKETAARDACDADRIRRSERRRNPPDHADSVTGCAKAVHKTKAKAKKRKKGKGKKR